MKKIVKTILESRKEGVVICVYPENGKITYQVTQGLKKETLDNTIIALTAVALQQLIPKLAQELNLKLNELFVDDAKFDPQEVISECMKQCVK